MEREDFWPFTDEERKKLNKTGINEDYINCLDYSIGICKVGEQSAFAIFEISEDGEEVVTDCSVCLDQIIKSFTSQILEKKVAFEKKELSVFTLFGLDKRRANSFKPFSVAIFKIYGGESRDKFMVARKSKDGNSSVLKTCTKIEEACEYLRRRLKKVRKGTYNPFEPLEKVSECMYQTIPFSERQKEILSDAISPYTTCMGMEEFSFNYIIVGKLCLLKLRGGKYMLVEPYLNNEGKLILGGKMKFSNFDKAVLELLRSVSMYTEQYVTFETYVLNKYGNELSFVGRITHLHIACITALLALLIPWLLPSFGIPHLPIIAQIVFIIITIIFALVGMKKEWQTLRSRKCLLLHGIPCIAVLLTIILPFIV